MSNDSSKQFLVLQHQFIANLQNRKQKFNDLYGEFLALELGVLDVKNAEITTKELTVLVSLHREVHNLTGTAGCYQLLGLSDVSRRLENHLWTVLRKVDRCVIDQAWQEKLYKYFAGLIHAVDELIKTLA